MPQRSSDVERFPLNPIGTSLTRARIIMETSQLIADDWERGRKTISLQDNHQPARLHCAIS
jgi:hypothetical protein